MLKAWRGNHDDASSATIDAAHNQPNEDPPRAEEGDDAVQEMVRTVILHVGCGMNLKGTEWEGNKGLIFVSTQRWYVCYRRSMKMLTHASMFSYSSQVVIFQHYTYIQATIRMAF